MISDFYEYAQRENIALIPYPIGFATACTIRLQGRLGVFWDRHQLDTVPRLNTHLLHEWGHCATGALHKVESPFELVARNEERADRWAIEHALPFEQLCEAIRQGDCEYWQLAERFELEEAFIRKAVYYYHEVKGLSFGEQSA